MANPELINSTEQDEENEFLNQRWENLGVDQKQRFRKTGSFANEAVINENGAQSGPETGDEPAPQSAEPQPEPQPEQQQAQQPEVEPVQPEAQAEAQNIKELSVDQLLDLDVTKLSRDELLYMQGNLARNIKH